MYSMVYRYQSVAGGFGRSCKGAGSLPGYIVYHGTGCRHSHWAVLRLFPMRHAMNFGFSDAQAHTHTHTPTGVCRVLVAYWLHTR